MEAIEIGLPEFLVALSVCGHDIDAFDRLVHFLPHGSVHVATRIDSSLHRGCEPFQHRSGFDESSIGRVHVQSESILADLDALMIPKPQFTPVLQRLIGAWMVKENRTASHHTSWIIASRGPQAHLPQTIMASLPSNHLEALNGVFGQSDVSAFEITSNVEHVDGGCPLNGNFEDSGTLRCADVDVSNCSLSSKRLIRDAEDVLLPVKHPSIWPAMFFSTGIDNSLAQLGRQQLLPFCSNVSFT